MCAHVFDGKSSACCSNYALRRTAVDNESIFGKDASEVLQNNFYVDDLLKFLKDVESAKELVKDVMNMCKAGGFQLTKFICQSQRVGEELMSRIKIYQVNFQMRKHWTLLGSWG